MLKLPDTLEECHKLLLMQQTLLDAFASRLSVLEANQKQHSQNSSRPPSSDYGKNTPPKKTTQPGIPKDKKPQGGQTDHKGDTLKYTETPDTTIQLFTPKCSCGIVLCQKDSIVAQKYQVFDLPEPKLQVTEYQRMSQVCSCGKIHLGELPSGVEATVQYGPNVRALTTVLNNVCQIPFRKVRMLFNDLFGYDLNEATVLNNNMLVAQALIPTEERIKSALLNSEVLHADESGIKINKTLNWLHVSSNADYTYLFVDEKRGKEAHKKDISILLDYKNWLVHDCFVTYFGLTHCRHALCNSHLLRELQFQVDIGKTWAQTIHAYLLELHEQAKNNSNNGIKLNSEQIIAMKEKWKILCQQAIEVEEEILAKINNTLTLFDDLPQKRGRKPRGKSLSLLDRLLIHADAVLAFAQFEFVPFTNNQAERDIRPIKTKIKVAGCFRALDSAKAYARIQGFCSTCRKHKLSIFNEIKNLLNLGAFYVAPFGC